ncbi:MAG: alpha/beta hydrolase [Bryobacteraceae bacterium]|nr:alpha/beta hydrolase [Bryobacteraceae bacterium]
MILISCRRDFVSDRLFASDNQVRNYPNLKNVDLFSDLDLDNVMAQAASKHVLVLVHGFRSPLKNVAASYDTVLTKLIDSGLRAHPHYDLVLGYTWPGFTTRLGFFPAVPYAGRAAGFFREFLNRLCRSALTVDVQTHSLGARVALQALSATEDVFIDNLLLSAPAVDNESLEPQQEFHEALDNCRRCLVYHSSKDKVLKLGFTFASLDRALGLKGPQNPAVIEAQCPSVFVVDCSAVVPDHGGYRRAAAYYSHWARVLADESLPRFEKLRA